MGEGSVPISMPTLGTAAAAARVAGRAVPIGAFGRHELGGCRSARRLLAVIVGDPTAPAQSAGALVGVVSANTLLGAGRAFSVPPCHGPPLHHLSLHCWARVALRSCQPHLPPRHLSPQHLAWGALGFCWPRPSLQQV